MLFFKQKVIPLSQKECQHS